MAAARLQRVHERHQLDLRLPDGKTAGRTRFHPLHGRREFSSLKPMAIDGRILACGDSRRHHAAVQPRYRAVDGNHPFQSLRSRPGQFPVVERVDDIRPHQLPLSGLHRHRGPIPIPSPRKSIDSFSRQQHAVGLPLPYARSRLADALLLRDDPRMAPATLQLSAFLRCVGICFATGSMAASSRPGEAVDCRKRGTDHGTILWLAISALEASAGWRLRQPHGILRVG